MISKIALSVASAKTPEEIEFEKRLSLLKQQQEEQQGKDMWEDWCLKNRLIIQNQKNRGKFKT